MGENVRGHRVGEVLAERAAAGSVPGKRDDGFRVALAIEGGGMRGTVSAGMALAVRDLGLLPLFDAVYGSSAGAISGAWLLSSGPDGLRGWTDPAFARALIRRRNLLRARPIVDVERLVEVVYLREFPLDFASVLANPVEFHPLATDVVTGRSVDLRPTLTCAADLRLALRASAALPVLAGRPVPIGAGHYYDAGVAESIPFRQALRDGATHILVLRSRRPQDTAPERGTPSLGTRVVAGVGLRRHSTALRTAFLARTAELAAADVLLARHDTTTPPDGPAIMSIRPAPDSPRVGRLESHAPVLQAAFTAGYTAITTHLTPALPSPP
ncbi:patatin-like phospholipase family protein [Actinocorallia sp. API 0066]|uniref:patatin-like phospholipase family protein n=1 Tax=Actinocorallia sp. API 0066 TaxID=2896846 RepID=UPI001E338761|nr:patatin-like phospholipase family protein [Actinocorallia sp. API 0066]MCD0451666.1 patatin-like phospholipase family protein [Actinocorallia sp. API 0066]